MRFALRVSRWLAAQKRSRRFCDTVMGQNRGELNSCTVKCIMIVGPDRSEQLLPALPAHASSSIFNGSFYSAGRSTDKFEFCPLAQQS